MKVPIQNSANNTLAAAPKNNGATIILGKVRGSVVTQALNKSSFSKLQYSGKYSPSGPWTVGEQGDYNHNTAKANTSSARFCNQVANKYVILGITRTIADLSNKILLGPVRNTNARSINYKEFTRVRQTYGKVFNLFTGKYTTNITTQRDDYVMLNGTVRDDAARPSYAIPGEFVVRYGSKSDPQLKRYSARNFT